MNAILQPPTFASAEEFLAWEEQQPERWEFIGGQVYAMVGARKAHNLIGQNACFWLRNTLRGTPCEVFLTDMKLLPEGDRDFHYPDVLVTCDPRDVAGGEDRFISHPWLIVEVLSDSTAAYDRGPKFEIYRGIDSLTHYLLIEQDRPHAELFFRGADGLWVLQPLQPGGQIAIDRLGRPWPVDSLFQDVEFSPPQPPRARLRQS